MSPFSEYMGQMVGLLILGVCHVLEVSQVINILKYLSLPHVLLLCALHLLASMITVLWTNGALRRQIFPFARRDVDLDWEEKTVLDEPDDAGEEGQA